MNNGEYWNPILETMPREKLQQLQLKKFKEIFTWAYEHSKFYHKLYSDAGIEPGDIKKFEDIKKVPKIEKSMMRSIQGKDPFPYGDILSVPLEAGDGLPPDQRHDGAAGLPGGYLAGLGVQHRSLLLRPVRPGLPGQRPDFPALRLQYFYRLLGLPLCRREAGLRGDSRRRP